MIPRPRIDRQQQLRDDNAADEDDVLCDERPSGCLELRAFFYVDVDIRVEYESARLSLRCG